MKKSLKGSLKDLKSQRDFKFVTIKKEDGSSKTMHYLFSQEKILTDPVYGEWLKPPMKSYNFIDNDNVEVTI